MLCDQSIGMPSTTTTAIYIFFNIRARNLVTMEVIENEVYFGVCACVFNILYRKIRYASCMKFIWRTHKCTHWILQCLGMEKFEKKRYWRDRESVTGFYCTESPWKYFFWKFCKIFLKKTFIVLRVLEKYLDWPPYFFNNPQSLPSKPVNVL